MVAVLLNPSRSTNGEIRLMGGIESKGPNNSGKVTHGWGKHNALLKHPVSLWTVVTPPKFAS